MAERRASSVERRGLAGLRMLMLVFALVLPACASGASADGPPDLNLGRDICDRCGMIIEDDRFAAGYRLGDGSQHLFDDIGGMLEWARLVGHLDTETLWVHDYDSREWIRAQDSTFVFSPGIMSPMAFGIAAFFTRQAATEFAVATDGTVHTWDEVVTLAEDGRIQDLHGEGAGGTGS